MRVVVAAGTLWLLFSLGLMLGVVGERRLMRVADSLLAVEFVALITASALDVESLSTVVALVIAPSLAVGFLIYCAQRALTDARR
jgi:hypothetical protein